MHKGLFFESGECELVELRCRLAAAGKTLRAIQRGERDAIPIDDSCGPHVLTLRSVDEPFRILSECISEGAACLMADGTILFCNQRLGEMVGRPSEKLVALPAAALVAPADREHFQHFLMHGMQGDAREEMYLERSDGHRFPVLASVKKIGYGHTPGLCFVAVDLSERKRMEESMLLLPSIVSNSDEAIIGKTPEGMITSWSRGAEAIYGYSQKEAIGRRISFIIPPERRQEFEIILDQVKRGKAVDHLQTVRVRKDGSKIDVSLSVSPIKDSGGTSSGHPPSPETSRGLTEWTRDCESTSDGFGPLSSNNSSVVAESAKPSAYNHAAGNSDVAMKTGNRFLSLPSVWGWKPWPPDQAVVLWMSLPLAMIATKDEVRFGHRRHSFTGAAGVRLPGNLLKMFG